MEFTYSNRNEINELYIHDSIYTGFVYNYKKRQITLSCDNYYLKKKFYFTFNNVISANIQSCTFWGGGNSILVIYLEENSSQLQELLAVQASNPNYRLSALDRGKQYFEVGFEINSGDTLTIISESVTYIEEEFNEEFPLKIPGHF